MYTVVLIGDWFFYWFPACCMGCQGIYMSGVVSILCWNRATCLGVSWSYITIGVVGPNVLSSSAVSCIEASGEGSKEAESLLGHLLLAVVKMVFVGPLVVGKSLVGRIGIKSSVIPIWGGWPSAVCLLMRHDVWVTSGDPERNDILRLEDGEQGGVRWFQSVTISCG